MGSQLLRRMLQLVSGLAVAYRVHGSRPVKIPEQCILKTESGEDGKTSSFDEKRFFDNTDQIAAQLNEFDLLSSFNLCVDSNDNLISLALAFISTQDSDSLKWLDRAGPQLGDCKDVRFESGSSMTTARVYYADGRVVGVRFGFMNGFVVQRLG